MSQLEILPNIGKVAASLLEEAGIDTPDKLLSQETKKELLDFFRSL